jgi:hypothetical protein
VTDTMLRVPGDLVRYLRRGLFGEWARTSEEIADLAHRRAGKANPVVYERRCAKFNAAIALLDAVGWKDLRSEGAVEVDLGLGATLVLRAFECEHAALVDLLAETGQTMTRASYDATSARIKALEELVKTVKRQARQLKPQVPEEPIAPSGVSPRRPRQAGRLYSRTRCPGY